VAIRFVVSCLRPHICSIDYMPPLPDSICIALSMKGVARPEHSINQSINQSINHLLSLTFLIGIATQKM
jgi:hypothetical protein